MQSVQAGARNLLWERGAGSGSVSLAILGVVYPSERPVGKGVTKFVPGWGVPECERTYTRGYDGRSTGV